MKARTLKAQGILITVRSSRGAHFSTKTRLESWKVSVQTTPKIRTQPHPSEDRLPQVILSSQPPQNTLLDTALLIRGTRYSSTHKRAGTNPSHQEAYPSRWTNLTHQGADTRNKRNYDPAACGKETPNTESQTKLVDREICCK